MRRPAPVARRLRTACAVPSARRSGVVPRGGRFYFYTNALKFTAEFIGMISLLDGLAQLLGAARIGYG